MATHERLIECPTCHRENPYDSRYCSGCGSNIFSETGRTEEITTPDEEYDANIGQIVKDCRITERIGEGGMGVVYKAVQLNLNRTVAVKYMRKEFCLRKEFVQRFYMEARSIANVNHPNIVQVFDAGEENGAYVMVMEFVEGRPVSDLFRDGKKIPVQDAVRYARDAAAGLMAAHRKNIIHRDIKPDNIMLTHDDVVKVGDFGLAKDAAQDTNLTATGKIIGTPHFMSPEQCKGVPCDHRTDIYSLGATFYFFLTGRAPFPASSPLAVLRHHIDTPITPPNEENPAVPARLSLIVERMMAKDPEDRFQNAAEVVAALDDYMKNAANRTAPMKSQRASVQKPDGRSYVLPVFVVSALVLVAGLVLFMVLTRIEDPGRDPQRETAFLQARMDVTLEKLKKLTVSLDVDAADKLYAQAEDLLDEAPPVAGKSLEKKLAEAANVYEAIKNNRLRYDALIDGIRGLLEQGEMEEAREKLAEARKIKTGESSELDELEDAIIAAESGLRDKLEGEHLSREREKALLLFREAETAEKADDLKKALALYESVLKVAPEGMEQRDTAAGRVRSLGERIAALEKSEKHRRELEAREKAFVATLEAAEKKLDFAEVRRLLSERKKEKTLSAREEKLLECALAWTFLPVKGEDISLGRYEVTNRQFARFVEAGGYEKDNYWSAEGLEWKKENAPSGPAYANDPRMNADLQPVTGVSYYEAEAFCAWATAVSGRAHRIPTKEEWLAAARANEKNRWTWGSDAREDAANLRDALRGAAVEVGQFTKDRGANGCMGMNGNVMEWCFGPDGAWAAGSHWNEWRDDWSLDAHARKFEPSARSPYLGFRVALENKPK